MSLTIKEFQDYECNRIGVLEAAGKTRAEAIEWLKTKALKPHVRVKAVTRMYGSGVPDDAQPGDLVIGNRGAAAVVLQPPSQFGGLCACLSLDYVGNAYEYGSAANIIMRTYQSTRKVYDFSGGTKP